MIITLTLNPALDKTSHVDALRPGSLNRLGLTTIDAGGKGINVSSMIAALGGKSIAVGFAGGTTGDELLARLTEKGITHDFVRIHDSTRTNLKIISSEGSLTELNERGPEITREEWQKLENKLHGYASKQSIFVLSGSLPRNLGTDTYLNLSRFFHAAGATVFVDADGELFSASMEAPPDYIKPNLFELRHYFNSNEKISDVELAEKCQVFINKGIKMVALSLGAEGALFVSSNGRWRSPSIPVMVRSTVGAGDSMVGALAYGLEKDLSEEQCIRLAMASSNAAVCTEGTKPPDRYMVDNLMPQVILQKI